MSCRLFNIGNTHVLTAELLPDGTLSDYRAFDTPGFDPEVFSDKDMAVVSVVPAWESHFSSKGAFVLNWKSCSPVLSLSEMGTPETVGADRIANSAALISTGKTPALCIDFGTAITCEYVDSDRNLRGGAILPGRQLLRKSLNDYTAKLPLIPLSDQLLSVPGKNTVEAMRIGTDTGAVGAVREILGQFRVLQPDLRLVFCGGDSAFFAPLFPEAEVYGADFTLKGLAHAFRVCCEHK